MPNEVEIKFRIENLRQLFSRLRSAGFRVVTPRTHEINTLYDLPGQKLRRRGELLRLRRYGSAWILTHKAKGKTGRHKSRTETETEIADGTTLEKIFFSLGLKPSFRYEKFRAEWSDDQGHVTLDETPLGTLGEIEGPPRWIDRTAKALGITPQDYITQSYAELFFTWKRKTRSAAREMTFKAIPRAKRKS